jgi:dihydroorotate dehydrogenase
MMRLAGRLALPFLLKAPPETAHRAAIAALKIAPSTPPPCDARLGVAAFGLSFANPLGMAAGFDKNAEVPDGLLGAGFGFAEVGTLTPRPQPGNARPRLFRLEQDKALINRLGFNNDGYAAAHARLSRREKKGIVGVNIGANKDSADRVADYVLGVKTFADVASYFTINISSPNTPGLRTLLQGDALD